jgi:putative hydrolase of the HAD superfamily
VHAAVLFDLDGTLVDHQAAARMAVLAWTRSRAADVTMPDDELTAEWMRLEQIHFTDYLARRVSYEEQRRLRLGGYLRFLGQPPPADESLDELFGEYRDHYERAWTAYDDVMPTLVALTRRGLTIGVLTNGEEAQQRMKLANVGLLPHFQHVIASSMLSASKPHVAAFEEACTRAGHPPHEVIYVGDNLETDALAATTAGLAGVWLNRLQAPDPKSAVPSITGLDGLIDLLDGV